MLDLIGVHLYCVSWFYFYLFNSANIIPPYGEIRYLLSDPCTSNTYFSIFTTIQNRFSFMIKCSLIYGWCWLGKLFNWGSLMVNVPSQSLTRALLIRLSVLKYPVLYSLFRHNWVGRVMELLLGMSFTTSGAEYI